MRADLIATAWLAAALLCGACSAFIVPDEVEAGGESLEVDTGESPNTDDGPDESGPPPHPLEGSDQVDCEDAEVEDICAWSLHNTAQSCELNCELDDPCPGFEVDFDHDTESYVGPVDGTTLGCLLDTLSAGNPAYLQWHERGVGSEISSDTIYRAWLLRPEELVWARWHESTVNGNIGDFGQELTAVSFDETQLLDCQDETEGSDRYTCMLQALQDAGCYGFGPASCE